MAKKRRRKRKYRKKNNPKQYRKENLHHLLWERKKWKRHLWSNKLRSHPACIVKMNVLEHRKIHEQMSAIPIAKETACEYAYKEIERLWSIGALNDNTDIETRISVLICLLDCSADDTTRSLERQLSVVRKIRGG